MTEKIKNRSKMYPEMSEDHDNRLSKESDSFRFSCVSGILVSLNGVFLAYRIQPCNWQAIAGGLKNQAFS
jgi:hypothetical protein